MQRVLRFFTIIAIMLLAHTVFAADGEASIRSNPPGSSAGKQHATSDSAPKKNSHAKASKKRHHKTKAKKAPKSDTTA